MKPLEQASPPSFPTDPSLSTQHVVKSQMPLTAGRDKIREAVPVRAPRQSKRPVERSK